MEVEILNKVSEGSLSGGPIAGPVGRRLQDLGKWMESHPYLGTGLIAGTLVITGLGIYGVRQLKAERDLYKGTIGDFSSLVNDTVDFYMELEEEINKKETKDGKEAKSKGDSNLQRTSGCESVRNRVEGLRVVKGKSQDCSSSGDRRSRRINILRLQNNPETPELKESKDE